METSRPPTITKKPWHFFQIVYFMLRKSISKRKLTIDLHLLRRSKIASKAFSNLMNFHTHEKSSASSSGIGIGIGNGFSCRSVDPKFSFYNPREVEFSCSNTPSYSYISKRKKHGQDRDHDHEAAAAIARAFQILNSMASDAEESFAPSPSPWLSRILDSPFPVKEDEVVADFEVDREADEFIRRFYEQLRRQQSIGSTPDYYMFCRG